MTKREIIKTLLAKEIPERVGFCEYFWPKIIDNAWGEQGMPAGTDLMKHFDTDLRPAVAGLQAGPRPDLETVLEETDEWKITRGSWGQTIKLWKHKSGMPEHVGFGISSSEVWKKEFRDQYAAINVRERTDLPALKKEFEYWKAREEFTMFFSDFVFEKLRSALGDFVMLESILLEPEWITDFCTVVTDKTIEYFELLFSELGMPDGIYICEDLGYTKAPFISPACHREMILPHHKRFFGFFKDHNLPIIMHSCGDFRPHLEAIIESGVDCIQPMEAKTGMNVVKLAEQYKDRICFMGNIDVRVLETGDRDKIKEECLSKLNGMKALRAPYIFGSDHSISYSVKLADYEYMRDLFWKNCRY